MDPIPLNEGQKAASDQIFEFLFSEEKEMIVSGPGGVGKTHLMRHCAKVLFPRYLETCKVMGIEPEYDRLVFTATTNKAAEVLGAAIGMPALTVHTFLGLRVMNGEDSGESALVRNEEDQEMPERLVVFVDECSMVDFPLWTHLNEGTLNCKFIFVGDHCQMAPVSDSRSPVFNQRSRTVHLTQQMRNSGQPALMELCAALREGVDRKEFVQVREVPGVIDVVDKAAFAREVREHFTEANQDSRILAYRNGTVIGYANGIRKHLRGYGTQFVEGEKLVVGSVYKRGKDRMNVEEPVTVERVRPPVRMNEDGASFEVAQAYLRRRLHPGLWVDYAVNPAHQRLLVNHYAKKREWKAHYRLKQAVADLRLAEVATVYKAQGSTYDTVYVDLDDLSKCPNPDQFRRMLYVAISRAKERVILYGDIVPRLGGPVIRA